MRDAFRRCCRRAAWEPLILACVCGTLQAATVWVEGENPATEQMNRHPHWYDKVKSDELSGADWISNWHGERDGLAAYELTIPADGHYHFHVRANPVGTKLSYRIDGGDWRLIPMSGAEDQVNVAADGAFDLRFVAWQRVGSIELQQGEHRIEFKMHSDNNRHGALDAFVFTTERFQPQGKFKPGELANQPLPEEEGSWAFSYPHDPFGEEALLDLRYLNEERAGQHGFIRLSDDGMDFVRGDGEPIRFWSVVGYGWRQSPEEMDRNARFLAKLGVNMVRIHANIAGTDEGQSLADVNEREIDQIWRFAKACRDNGIYLTLSPYWYHHRIPASWAKDLDGYQSGEMPAGALFFNPAFIEAYKTWVRRLYTATNPVHRHFAGQGSDSGDRSSEE